MESKEIITQKIKKIFKVQFAVLGITIVWCIAAVVTVGLLVGLALGPGDGLGGLVVFLYGLIALAVLFIVEFLGLGIWGIFQVMMIRQSNPQLFKEIFLGKISIVLSALFVLSSLSVIGYGAYTFYLAFY